MFSIYLLTGAFCCADTYYSAGNSYEGIRYFVTYEEAKAYNDDFLQLIVNAHNSEVAGDPSLYWEVYSIYTGGFSGNIVESLDWSIRGADGNPVLGAGGEKLRTDTSKPT